MAIEVQDDYRILVLGSPGSGKSTLTNKLSKILNIKAIHLDKYFWQSNWVQTKPEEWNIILKAFLEKDCWIMDGNYSDSLSDRVKYASHIIYLDIPLYKSLWRLILRMIKYRNKTRPDIGVACYERLNLQFMQFIFWTIKFNSHYKKNLMKILFGNQYDILKNSKSIDNWITTNF